MSRVALFNKLQVAIMHGSGVARVIELVGPQLRMCRGLTTPTN